MKKRIAFLLALLVCLWSGAALADDYGKAIIDAPSGRLHLLEEPSSSSESQGLYFTGTSVTLESEIDNGWVEVRIGRERGWMKAAYLKVGASAERVEDAFWQGTISATRYARMRHGPSTEYQFIRNVPDGESLTIMGETEEGWYYVLYQGDKGFISKNLINTSGSFISWADDDANDPDIPAIRPLQGAGWREAYRGYVMANAGSGDAFALIYVNSDSVPELVIDSGIEADGCRILTYAQGQLGVLATRRRGFSYIERGNRLCNSDGNMDNYYDDVYEIREGQWVCIARGEYFGYLSGWNEILQRYVCSHYIWNGQKTDIGQYMISLNRVFDEQRAVGAEERVSLGELLGQL